jgi:hypothetical protein
VSDVVYLEIVGEAITGEVTGKAKKRIAVKTVLKVSNAHVICRSCETARCYQVIRQDRYGQIRLRW